MPRMWIVAGINGAGKTTLSRQLLADEVKGLVWVNPDETTNHLLDLYADLGPGRGPANLAAAHLSEFRIDHLIETAQSFIAETVLSSDKYERRLQHAHSQNFEVFMIYVTLLDAEMAIERVRARVALGGHPVPEGKIRERFERSHDHLVRFLPLLDRLMVFDNSFDPDEGEPMLVLEKDHNDLNLYDTTFHDGLVDRLIEVHRLSF
jgi:predicted ABC-type ATPase